MRRSILTAVAVAAAVVSLPGVASAADPTYVTPTDFSTCSPTMTTSFCEFQRGDGTVDIGAGSTDAAFGGTDHLLFNTPLVSNDKATAFSYEFVGEFLADIDTLGYSSRVTRVSTADARQAPALNIEVDRNGGTLEPGDYATLVWEPVYVASESTDAYVWLTRSPAAIASGGWWTPAKPTDPPLATGQPGPLGFNSFTASWADVQSAPALAGATVLGIGVNQGGGNQGLASEVDLLQVNGTVYDFESTVPVKQLTPAAKNDCKGDNWTTFNAPAFRNQGQCVSFLMSARSGR